MTRIYYKMLFLMGLCLFAPTFIFSNIVYAGSTAGNSSWNASTQAKSVTKEKMTLFKNRNQHTNINAGRPLWCDHFSSDVITPLKDVSIGKHRFKAGEEALLKIEIERRLECDAQHLSISVPSCFKVYDKYNNSVSGKDLIWRIGAPLRWNFKLKASSSCRQRINYKQYINVHFAHAGAQQKKVEVIWSKPFVAPTMMHRQTTPTIHKFH